MTSDQGRDQWPPDDGQKRPGPSAAVTDALAKGADKRRQERQPEEPAR